MRNIKSILTLYGSNILVLLFLFFGVGCSSPEEQGKRIEKPADPKLFTVLIQQMKFTPAELYVNAGDTVMWINKDIVDHNIMDETNKEWSSSILQRGKSWKMVVTKNADYFCSIHPVMKGKLILK